MLRARFAYDVRHVARVIMQMLRAPAARGARNKGCYFWTPLYPHFICTVDNQRTNVHLTNERPAPLK
jgi:hypothetical protein